MMPHSVSLPCGRSFIDFSIDSRNFIGSFSAALPAPDAPPVDIVRNALAHPIDSPSLAVLARNADSAVIISSDHTRPLPSHITMPILLQELRSANPGIRITILIATGCHRAPSHEELVEKFGPQIVASENIAIHNAFDPLAVSNIGPTPSGATLEINSIALNTDLLIAEGFIEPHLFAGFSGGRKSILPGIASFDSIRQNHCAAFIDNPRATTGSLVGNPIHDDMTFAAKRAKLAFILNLVLDDQKQIIRAFSGNPVSAHLAGCNFVANFSRINVPQCDIVITSNAGYPQDRNVNQCVKGLSLAARIARKDGVIILAAACCDGHGDPNLYNALKNAPSIPALLQSIRNTPRHLTVQGLWQCQILCNILTSHHVIITGAQCPAQILHDMGFLTADSPDQALDLAFQLSSPNARVAVIPNAVSVFPA